jgi:uncharacterized membrane protein
VNKLVNFVLGSLLAGLLIVVPVYLTAFLMLKVVSSLMKFVEPIAKLLPQFVPGQAGEDVIALILVLLVCFLVGLSVRARRVEAMWERAEPLLQRIPGYSIFRGFTRRLAGDTREDTWKPVLAEIEHALVPAFIVETLADGRFTVFVPAVPAPFTGVLYILDPDRVHPVDVPFTHAIRTITHWGSGCSELVAAMARKEVSRRGAAS